jgi:hypothetical protein
MDWFARACYTAVSFGHFCDLSQQEAVLIWYVGSHPYYTSNEITQANDRQCKYGAKLVIHGKLWSSEVLGEILTAAMIPATPPPLEPHCE